MIVPTVPVAAAVAGVFVVNCKSSGPCLRTRLRWHGTLGWTAGGAHVVRPGAPPVMRQPGSMGPRVTPGAASGLVLSGCTSLA